MKNMKEIQQSFGGPDYDDGDGLVMVMIRQSLCVVVVGGGFWWYW